MRGAIEIAPPAVRGNGVKQEFSIGRPVLGGLILVRTEHHLLITRAIRSLSIEVENRTAAIRRKDDVAPVERPRREPIRGRVSEPRRGAAREVVYPYSIGGTTAPDASRFRRHTTKGDAGSIGGEIHRVVLAPISGGCQHFPCPIKPGELRDRGVVSGGSQGPIS